VSTRNSLLAFGALILAACGGGGGAGDVAPLGSPEAAVREFMAAVQDSNIMRMGRSWGGENGPAIETHQPAQWEQRLKVVQFYLRGGNSRITSNTAVVGDVKHRNVLVEFTRGSCVKSVPFLTVQSRRGWLVEAVDISTAGNPTNPCPPPPGTQAAPPGGN
jgi:hypothetical protein